MELQHELLIDQESLVSASPDNVFVLQTEPTNGRIPFFSDNKRLEKWQVSGSTHHVVAGLMSALAGLVPPGKHFSPLYNRTVSLQLNLSSRIHSPCQIKMQHQRTDLFQAHDWIWSVGHQPWAPFSSTPALSDVSDAHYSLPLSTALQLSASLVLRNFVITNLHVAHQIAHKVIVRLDSFTQKCNHL